jgi:crotonobetainyl-CoA:carnitine CoA-transferase CaiB-like acyl-CoA transferase
MCFAADQGKPLAHKAILQMQSLSALARKETTRTPAWRYVSPMAGGGSDSRSLAGILVVSLEHAVAAPLASCRLADAGARVIKLERPGGDFARHYDHAANGISTHFAWLNRGKESIVVDLTKPEDRALILRMIARADVFIQNLAVGAARRAGLGSEALRRIHPRLVTCDISGYGDSGPYSDMKAYDLLVQGESGLLSVSGPPGPIGRVGVSVCDIGAGLNAVIAIQQALLRRAKTGTGDSIRISLFDSIADWMAVPYMLERYTGRAPERLGVAHPSIAPYGEFCTQEGASVLISIQNEREWSRFAGDVLEKPEWGTDERYATNVARVRNRKLVDSSIQEIVGNLPRDELIRRLRRTRIAFGMVNDVAGLREHPQLNTIVVQTELGPVSYPASPVHSSEPPLPTAVPKLDEHGGALRKEFA